MNHLPSRFDIQRVEMRSFSKGIWNRISIMLQARKFQSDINHVTGDIHFATLLLKKNKTILTIHDCRLLDELEGIKYYLFRYFWFYLPLQRSRFITVVSTFTLSRLKQHLKVDQSKVKVIPVAISEKFHSQPKDFEQEKPVILQVGTVVNKNFHRVVEALNGIPCHLRILGDLSAFDQDILKINQIDFSSSSDLTEDEVIDEYVKADMLIFVSTYEGFGMPILEAQTTGRVVITSNIASMPEVAGDAACLVDPYDVESIRQGVLKIIQDSEYRSELVQKGFANVKRFQLTDIVSEYTSLYDSISNPN